MLIVINQNGVHKYRTSDQTFQDPALASRHESDAMIEDAEVADVIARLRTRVHTGRAAPEEEYQRERRHAAKLNCGELRTHITAGEIEELLEALADRMDTAHSRMPTEGRPKGIERAYSACRNCIQSGAHSTTSTCRGRLQNVSFTTGSG